MLAAGDNFSCATPRVAVLLHLCTGHARGVFFSLAAIRLAACAHLREANQGKPCLQALSELDRDGRFTKAADEEEEPFDERSAPSTSWIDRDWDTDFTLDRDTAPTQDDERRSRVAPVARESGAAVGGSAARFSGATKGQAAPAAQRRGAAAGKLPAAAHAKVPSLVGIAPAVVGDQTGTLQQPRISNESMTSLERPRSEGHTAAAAQARRRLSSAANNSGRRYAQPPASNNGTAIDGGQRGATPARTAAPPYGASVGGVLGPSAVDAQSHLKHQKAVHEVAAGTAPDSRADSSGVGVRSSLRSTGLGTLDAQGASPRRTASSKERNSTAGHTRSTEPSARSGSSNAGGAGADGTEPERTGAAVADKRRDARHKLQQRLSDLELQYKEAGVGVQQAQEEDADGDDEFPNVNSPIGGIVTASRQQPAQQPLGRKRQQQQPYAEAPSAAVRHTGPAGGKLPALSDAPKPQTSLPASAPKSQLARPSAPAPSSGFPSKEADLLGGDLKAAHSAQRPSSVLSHIVQRPGSRDSAARTQALLKVCRGRPWHAFWH